MIRGHEPIVGEPTATRLDATLDGNMLSFENDLFSTFVIVYEDVADVQAPVTGMFTGEGGSAAGDTLAMVVVAVAAVTLGAAVKFAKRR